MCNYSFAVRWSEEDQEYVATSPEFAGLSGLGRSAEEAPGSCARHSRARSRCIGGKGWRFGHGRARVGVGSDSHRR
jgi:hypothetical protein